MTLVAEWEINKYIVTWIVDGTETEETYEYGTTPEFKGTTDKAADAQYTYTFVGWDTTIAPVTGDVTYTAKYDKTVNKYTVTWIVDGTETEETYEYGTTPEFKGTTDKAADAQYTYTFVGWDTTIAPVTGDVTYTAKYDKTVNKYTVTWANEDGTVLDTDEVEYGTVPSYAGTKPTKVADETYTYEFADWNKEVVAVTGDVTYKATYTPTYINYTVKFVVDGETVSEKTYHYGDNVTVPADPTKDATAQYTYTFAGWDKAVTIVEGNATYTAKFNSTVNEYTVTYVDASNNTLGTEKVKYGTLVSTLTAPTKEGYEFDNFNVDGTTTITGDTTLVVNYNKIVNVEESLKTNLATVKTNDLLKLDVADNKINALFAAEDTSLLLILDPIVDVLEQITSNEAYESVVVSYNGKTLVLSNLDYSKLGLINFMLKEEDATEVARFVAWVALGSGSGSDIAKVKPKDLIGKSLDVKITLADGNISENSNLIEYYDLVFGLTTE